MNRFSYGLVIAAALVGGMLSIGAFNISRADAQQAVLVPGHYQVSAYGVLMAGNVYHCCYMVDTATGKVWHVLAGGKPEKVSTKP